jgi:hypothetical protein
VLFATTAVFDANRMANVFDADFIDSDTASVNAVLYIGDMDNVGFCCRLKGLHVIESCLIENTAIEL